MSNYSLLLIEYFYEGLRKRDFQLKDAAEEREYQALKAKSNRHMILGTGIGTCFVLAFDHFAGPKIFRGSLSSARIGVMLASAVPIIYAASRYSFQPRQAELAVVLANRYEEELLRLYPTLKEVKARSEESMSS
mmetsp:Transcript_20102/g.37347  ORF Transcript_20102/g.37347 Transcript_20102/m.37347 type:complete len:134 (-) Transcript_20102:5466-5867(-)